MIVSEEGPDAIPGGQAYINQQDGIAPSDSSSSDDAPADDDRMPVPGEPDRSADIFATSATLHTAEAVERSAEKNSLRSFGALAKIMYQNNYRWSFSVAGRRIKGASTRLRRNKQPLCKAGQPSAGKSAAAEAADEAIDITVTE